MAFRWFLLIAPVALAASIQLSSAAQIGYPLPPDSTERNGAPHHKISHTILPKDNIKLAPLPDRGLHSDAEDGLKRRYSGTPIDVLRYHNDNYPTGWNPSETDLTPTTVGSASFGLITTLNVDGNVLAEPLMVSNFTMPDSSVHNVLIVATGNNTVYAYDAQTYDILWQRNLGTQQSSNDVGCGDIQGGYGISSTPVIVRKGKKATIYLIAATEPAKLSFHTQLHALDLSTGEDTQAPREIAPERTLETGGKIHFDPQNQWTRSALAYNNGTIYVGFGSHCDNNAGAISGWVLSYNAKNLKPAGRFNTIEAQAGYELSSVWMSGYSVAIDPAGDVYAVTGNGNYSQKKGQKGYGESVIALTPDLNQKPVGTFTPNNWQNLNGGDTDFGSGGAMLIPVVSGQTTPPMLVAAGKQGTAYLLDSSNLLGMQGNGTSGYQPLQTVSVGGCWCGAAYFGASGTGVVYYQGSGAKLGAYSVATTGTPQLTPIATSSDGAGSGGSFPVVSSNGNTANTAIVWAIERGNPTEQLKAYNAVSLGAPLFQANAGTWSNGSRSYLTPLVANGRVYVGGGVTGSPNPVGTVTVFGLTD